MSAISDRLALFLAYLHQQSVAQYDSMVPDGIAEAVKQGDSGDSALLDYVGQVVQSLVVHQFLKILLAEGVPVGIRCLVKKSAKFCGRCQVLAPQIILQVALFDTAWPHTVY